MNLSDRRGLKAAAADALAQAPDHRKLVLLWAGIGAAIPLLASLISLLLDSGIAETGGLAGIGTRTFLTTVKSTLSLAVAVLTPFWSLGYTRLSLLLARRAPAAPKSLLFGFSRLGPALRLLLLEAVLYMGLAAICFSVGSTVLAVTPLANGAYEVLLPYMDTIAAGQLPPESVMDAAAAAMLPAMLICTALTAAVLVPMTYRLRMADFVLMDDPRCGAFAALRTSSYLMHRRGFRLFRLDLSFWWFYLVQGLITVLCYGDVILQALGIPLPISSDAAYFLFYALSLAAQVAFFWAAKNPVGVTYALAYDSLRLGK